MRTRKAIYLGLVCALLAPLVWLGQPRTADERSQGGLLARLRTEHKLGQMDLGQVDPTSETIKLATLGLRGVAAQALWSKAHEYKKKENWTEYATTLDQLARVMPNFVGVWRFQAWNLSYNVPAQFDDYRQKYQWVKRGIEFLKLGQQYNANQPRILVDIGWFISQKIGRSDNRALYRPMFRAEREAAGEQIVDSWLVGRQWYLRAQRMIDRLEARLAGDATRTIRLQGENTRIFHSRPALNQIYYAKAIQEDGFGDEFNSISAAERRQLADRQVRRWAIAWRDAADQWHRGPESYGERALKTGDGRWVELNDLERLGPLLLKPWRRLNEIAPSVVAQIVEQHRGEFDEPAQDAVETPREKRTDDHRQRIAEAVAIHCDVTESADRFTESQRDEALRALEQMRSVAQRMGMVRTARDPVNFETWRSRTEMESKRSTLEAHRHFELALQARLKGRLTLAKRHFQQSFAHWRRSLDEYPVMLENEVFGDDLLELVGKYRDLIIEDLEEPFPQDFPLRDVIERYDVDHRHADLFAAPESGDDPTGR